MSQSTPETPAQAEAHEGERNLVPVSESIRYRKRAQQAEARCKEMEQKLQELQQQLAGQQDQLAAAEAQRDESHNRQTLLENRLAAERLLSESGVVDLEAASLLLGQRLNLTEELDREALARSIEQLLLDKPFLRSETAPGAAGLPPKTASAKGDRPATASQLAEAADRAIRSGDRRDVAEYLRLRRQSAAH